MYTLYVPIIDLCTGIVSHYHMIDHLLSSAALVTELYLTKSALAFHPAHNHGMYGTYCKY